MPSHTNVPFKRRLLNGEPVLNGFCTIGSTVTAEIMARQPFGAITIDLQHGLIGYEKALMMLQVIQANGKPVLCRASSNDAAELGRALDAGFVGVICPGIEDASGATRFTEATAYPPRGHRSFGAARAAALHGPSYFIDADDIVVRFAMIGNLKAVENVGAILSVDGIDGVYIAPSDLALSCGLAPTQKIEDARLAECIATVVTEARLRGKFVGTHCGTAEDARTALAGPYHLASLMTDLRIYSQAIEQLVQRALPP